MKSINVKYRVNVIFFVLLFSLAGLSAATAQTDTLKKDTLVHHPGRTPVVTRDTVRLESGGGSMSHHSGASRGGDETPATAKTPAALTVTPSGAASYTVPFAMPPGINGVVPQLALAYNSQSGNGVAGYGWRISGQSAVTRIPATKFHNGRLGSVNLDTADRFALDGQRLLLKSGTYGTDGAAYQTEQYSNINILSVGTGTYGPDHFEVYYPDGSIAFYGSTSGSKNTSTYALTYWQNAQGVRINYSYTTDNNTLYLSEVAYGALTTGTPLNTVDFTYDTADLYEHEYEGGQAALKTKLLTEVHVSGDGSSPYRNYYLTHDDLAGLNYQLLTQVQELSGDEAESFSPIVFNYPTPSLSSTSTEVGSLTMSGIDATNAGIITGDFTGNGQMDFILYPEDKDQVYLYFDPVSNPTDADFGKYVATDPFTDIFAGSFLDSSGKLHSRQGFALVKESTSNHSDVDFEVYSAPSYSSVSSEYTRTWAAPTLPDFYSNCDAAYLPNARIPRKYYSGDFNGDGLTDLLALSMGYDTILVRDISCVDTKHAAQASSVDFIDLDRRLSSGFAAHAGTIPFGSFYTGDFNGDGKTDLLSVRPDTLYIYDLDASGAIESLWKTAVSVAYAFPPLLGDYNGDGKTDLMFPKSDTAPYNTGFDTFTSTGKGFDKDTATQPFAYIPEYWSGTHLLAHTLIPSDVNGDGKTDIVDLFTHTRDAVAIGNVTATVYNNTGYAAIGDSPSFVLADSVVYSSVNLKHYPIPVFLDHNQPNFHLEFGLISDETVRMWTRETDVHNEALVSSIDQDDLTYSIDYQNLIPGQPADIPVYTAGSAQVFPYTDIEVAPGLNVVSTLTRDFNSNTVQQVYGYKAAVSHEDGLGFLGFSEAIRSNWHTDSTDANRLFSITVKDPALRGAVVKQFTSKNATISSGKKDVNPFPPDIELSTALTAAQTTEATHEINLVPGFEADATNGEFVGQITAPSVGIADGASLSDYITRTDYTYKTDLLSSKVFVNVPTSTATKNLLTGTNTLAVNAYDSYFNPLKQSTYFSGIGSSVTEMTYGNSSSGTWYFGRPLTRKTTLNNGSDTWSTETQWGSYSNFLPTEVKTKGNGTDWMTDDLTYDSFGNVTAKSTTSPGSVTRSVSAGYDTSGRFLTSSTDVEGLTSSWTYNSDTGTPATATNPYSLGSSYTYDSWNRLTQATDYLGKNTYRDYAASGGDFTVTETDDQGSEQAVTTNTLGQVTLESAKDVLGQSIKTAYQYDVYDRRIKASEPFTSSASQWNETQYDEYNRVTKQTEYTGKETDFSYSGLATTADDGTKSVTTTGNAMGQTASVVDPGGTISYTYFANGNLKTSSFDGTTQTIEQDGWGRKTKLTDPSAGIYTYTYNDFGETTQEVTPKGTTDYTITGTTGKLTAKSISGDHTGMSYSYSYDGTTKLPTGYTLSNSDGNNATYTYSYDSYKRMEGITEDNTSAKFTKTLTYDAFGRVGQEAEQATNKSNSATARRAVVNTYQYGQLKSIADSTSANTLHNVTGLNARGQLTEATMGSGTLKQLNSYDSDGMLTELKTNRLSGTPATLMTLDYSFDAQRGNLDSRSNNAFATTWSEDFDYDELDRLTDFNDNNGSRSQSYEGSGRIATNSRLGTYTYGSNPYQQTGLTSLTDYAKYHYQNDPLQEVTYNAFKAPTRIEEQGKEKIDFQYNGGLNRAHMYYGSEDTAKTARPFRRHYSEDGSVEITEDLVNSKTSFVFYLGGDAYNASAIWKYSTSGAGTTDAIYYLYRDHIGSINLITDDSGNAVEKRQFDAWGQLVKLEDGSGNPLTAFSIIDRGYTGHEQLLGVGLINMNARLYDPILHRFLGPDNNIQDPTYTQSYNRYAYVWNNPLKYWDPSGETVTWEEWNQAVTKGLNSPYGGSWTPETGFEPYSSGGSGFEVGAAYNDKFNSWNFAEAGSRQHAEDNYVASGGILLQPIPLINPKGRRTERDNHKSGNLNIANDWLGSAGNYGEVGMYYVARPLMSLSREAVPYVRNLDHFEFAGAFRFVGAAGKTLGKLGPLAAGISTVLDVNSYQNGEIGAERLTYRQVGNWGGLALATFASAGWGAIAAAGTWAGEKSYDGTKWFLNQSSTALGQIEYGLNNGWVPGRQ